MENPFPEGGTETDLRKKRDKEDLWARAAWWQGCEGCEGREGCKVPLPGVGRLGPDILE